MGFHITELPVIALPSIIGTLIDMQVATLYGTVTRETFGKPPFLI